MDSKTYWKQREEENLKKNLKTEEEYIKAVHGCYDYMMDQIQKEINGFYAKYAKAEKITLAEAKKRVSKLDIEAYARKAKKYVKDKDFSDEANAEMRLYNATMKINRLELLKANIGLELVAGFDELQKYYEEVLTERTLEEFERQAGILGKTVLNNEKAAHAVVNASFANAKFSDRIWMYQDMMKAELSKLLQEGLIQGRNPRQLAKHLTKLFGVSKSNAERLMRTELARVQTEAQKQSFDRNGYTQYEFIALGSACDVCRALDGKHFDVDKMMPGENAPPMHPHCRCSVCAYMGEKEFEHWLSGKESVVKSGRNDTIKSGARITNPESKEGRAFAENFYPQIRKRATDSAKIAKNLGKPEEEIRRVKEYLFINKSLYDEDLQIWRQFDADCAIAQSWQRLTDGKNIKKHDRTLIEHELYEMKLKETNPNFSHEEAHALAQRKYNYKQEVKEYYANLDKSD